MKHFHVAAGILRDASGRVLITQRSGDGPYNGLWEFPGGKISGDEDPAAALSRELTEEIGVTITASRPFMDLYFKYPDRTVDLEFFLVTAWEGDPAGLEGQALRWLLPSELHKVELLPADKPVIEALRSL